MAVTSFIPKLWSARLLAHLDKTLVFANLVNRDYEGEISNYGDTVNIGKLGDVTVKTYNKNSTINSPDQLNMTNIQLIIDQADYFNFGIDDVDAAQIRTEIMDKAMSRAAYAMADKVDRYLVAEMAKKIATRNTGGNANAGDKITKDNAYSKLVDLKVKMDSANVPSAGRYIVVPPEFEGLMLLDQRFAGANSAKSEAALTNGFVGRAAGFDIYISNNCPKTTNTYTCIASVKDSTTFVQQIVKTEAFRPQDRFNDAVKGLSVYGSKVTTEEMVYAIYADFTAPEAP